jgi:predicted dehydrogenase
MTKIGIVGVGFMGMIHYLAAQKLRGATVTAICSRDPKKLAGDWRSIQGNFGPGGDVMDLSNIKRYDRVDSLLADPEIDLIDICLPTTLHDSAAIAALKANKHVLVEKPICLEVGRADAMLEAAAKSRKLLMVGQVLPFFPEFRFAAEAIRDGRYGKLQAAHFKRVISRPDWSSASADPEQTGGAAIDLHIHDTHFIGLVCGVPRAVNATGWRRGSTVEYLTTQYLYGEESPAVSCCCGALAQKGRPFVHGFEIYLERATLTFESGTVPLTVLTEDGKNEQPSLLPGSDDLVAAFTDEIQAAVDGVAAGRAPPALDAKLARDALGMCLVECESIRSGRAQRVI